MSSPAESHDTDTLSLFASNQSLHSGFMERQYHSQMDVSQAPEFPDRGKPLQPYKPDSIVIVRNYIRALICALPTSEEAHGASAERLAYQIIRKSLPWVETSTIPEIKILMGRQLLYRSYSTFIEDYLEALTEFYTTDISLTDAFKRVLPDVHLLRRAEGMGFKENVHLPVKGSQDTMACASTHPQFTRSCTQTNTTKTKTPPASSPTTETTPTPQETQAQPKVPTTSTQQVTETCSEPQASAEVKISPPPGLGEIPLGEIPPEYATGFHRSQLMDDQPPIAQLPGLPQRERTKLILNSYTAQRFIEIPHYVQHDRIVLAMRFLDQ